MRTTSLRPQARRVSIASRVVPGTSDTIERSSPRRALSRLDLPTLGRPTKAIAAGSASSAAIAASHFAASGSIAARSMSGSSLVAVVAVRRVRLVADHEGLQATRGDLVGPRLGIGLARLARELALALGRQRPDDRVEQVTGPAAVRGGDRVGLVPAHGVELGALELALLVVGLVDRHDDRRLGPPQDVRGLAVRGGHPGRGIHHEDDDVGLGDGQPGLLLDAGLDGVVRVELEPAGVDDHEPPVVPLPVAVEAVTGRPGAVLDDGRAPADDPVEERALADIGTPDDGDDREPVRAAAPRVRRRRTWRSGPGSGARWSGRPAWRPRRGRRRRGARRRPPPRACRRSRRSSARRRAGPRSGWTCRP